MAFPNHINFPNIEEGITSKDEIQPSTAHYLCCCEYINKDNRRSHLLACCCNCYDLDLAFTRLVCCESVESYLVKNMLLTFQDRLRLPWRGGAKQITLDIWFSALAVAMVLTIAAINAYTAIITIVASVLVINYSYYYVKRCQMKTRIFAFCTTWFALYMIILMEFVVPLLEFLPEEHFLLIVLAGVSAYCLVATYRRSRLSFVLQSSVNINVLPDIGETTTAEEQATEKATQTALHLESSDSSAATNINGKICNTCHKYMTTGTVHCQLCGACILQQSHHSYWLNCCIGQWNYYYYTGGMCFGIMTLLLWANLTLTAICHPYIIVRLFNIAIMLPDDCSEVFSEYFLGLSFIMAIYALIIAVYLLINLLKQIFHITRNSNSYLIGTRKRFTSIKKWKDILF